MAAVMTMAHIYHHEISSQRLGGNVALFYNTCGPVVSNSGLDTAVAHIFDRESFEIPVTRLPRLYLDEARRGQVKKAWR